ncbi:FLICE-associated huge protein [Bombus fervidus]|uniref:FLICE-associated huge protein n=1 Tax=Bombus fervidus TaxID=203811 RepID=UPI003AB481B2
MEDDIDIYEDLPDFGTEFHQNFVSNNGENIVEEQVNLKKQIAELTTKLENFQKVNKNLESNLFSLLKTAKAEIARKDKMIDELRKKLDDVTFRRNMYSKTNDYVNHKSNVCETVVNIYHKSTDICFPADENGTEMLVADSLYSQSKDQQNKSTLVPITVFGERLLKRMTDEQNLEKKDKQSNKLSSSDNDNKNNKGYVVESDKENGFLSDINYCNIKEIQSSTIAQYKGGEHIKSPLTDSRSTIKDLQSNNKNEMSSVFQRKPIFTNSTTYKGKRASEETSRHIHVKRIKSSEVEHCFETTKKEIDNISESKEKSMLLLYPTNSESSTHSKEKELNIKSLEYTRNSNTELKKHGYFVDDANREDEKKDTKNKRNLLCDRRDINEHFSKRRNKPAQSATSILDKKEISYRCTEILERDNYRSNHNEHRSRRDKQREYHRMDDHRSRVRSTPYTKSNREDKYGRNQYSKQTIHDEKFEKRYNFRSTGATEKSKISKKDSSNVRGTKHSTLDRISAGQKLDDIKKTQNYYNEHESRKIRLKNADKSIKRYDEDKHDEHSKCSYRKVNAENLIEHPKHSQVSREMNRKDVGITQTANELEIDDELQKYAKEELKNSFIDLEDGEISNSSNNSSLKDADDKYEGLKDRQVIGKKIPEDLPSTVNNTSIMNSIYNSVRNETVEKLKTPSDTLQTIPISDTNITCIPDNKSYKNKEIIESVENVENIEKFIRDYAPTCDKVLGNISGASNTIHIFNDSQLKSMKKEEQTTEALSASPKKIISFSENHQTDKKVIDTVTSNENNVAKHDYTAEQMTSLNDAKEDCVIPQKNDSIELNSSELTKNNCLSNDKMEQTSDQSNAQDKSLENTLIKNSVISETSKGTEFKQQNNDTSMSTADLTNDDIRNNYDNSNNRDEGKINQNSSKDVTKIMKDECENINIITGITREGKCDKYAGKTKEIELKEFKKSIKGTNDDRSTKISSMNVQGKIVVFARRKKPVCLANSNANMTVLINNKHNHSVDLSITNIVKTNDHDMANTS